MEGPKKEERRRGGEAQKRGIKLLGGKSKLPTPVGCGGFRKN